MNIASVTIPHDMIKNLKSPVLVDSERKSASEFFKRIYSYVQQIQKTLTTDEQLKITVNAGAGQTPVTEIRFVDPDLFVLQTLSEDGALAYIFVHIHSVILFVSKESIPTGEKRRQIGFVVGTEEQPQKNEPH